MTVSEAVIRIEAGELLEILSAHDALPGVGPWRIADVRCEIGAEGNVIVFVEVSARDAEPPDVGGVAP